MAALQEGVLATPTEHVIVYREPGPLIDFEGNARRHSNEQIDQIAASIQRFGFNNPVALKDDQRTIGAGHGRRAAALRILAAPAAWGSLNTPDGRTIPTITLAGLTDDEWRAYVIADNRIAETATWDFEVLRTELAEIKLGDMLLPKLAGFSDAELAALLNLNAPPTLEELEARHGRPAAADFWPEIKLQAPPALKAQLDKLLAAARAAGPEPWQRLQAVLNAVDAGRLP